ncbi:MAG: ROK family transcriptional regulator [Pyrinomonadaceae bacterium]
MHPRRMRAHNSQRVLGAVKKSGPLSRADITRETQLSPPTVSALVHNLLKAGLVTEQGEGISNGGRKPQLVSFNARCGVILGANIGSTSVHLCLADMTGEIIEKRSVPLPIDTRPRFVIRRLISTARAMLKDIVNARTPLLAAAIGAPGMTDLTRGVVLEAANLDNWINIPAREMLAAELHVPVLVENDVNLAAIGEHWRGGGRGVHNFVFISMGTGIGAGIVIDDKLHRGHRWHAGEISHLNVDFREWATDFGAAGYLESYLGAMPRKKTNRAPRRTADGAFNDEAVLRLGAAVANLATIIDPELIIFGGRVAIAMPELLPRVHEVAARIAPNCPAIRGTELGEDAPLIGSIRAAMELANESLHKLMQNTHRATA